NHGTLPFPSAVFPRALEPHCSPLSFRPTSGLRGIKIAIAVKSSAPFSIIPSSSVNKPATGDKAQPQSVAQVSNFIRNIIEDDLAQGKYAGRKWSGKPGPAS